MKKSNLMLISGTAVIIVILIALLAFFRVAADKFISFSSDSSKTIISSGILETKEFNFKNFDSLNFSSVWNVEIKEGEEYAISITADKALLDELKVEQSGQSVNFSYERYLQGGSDSDNTVKVIITIPDLREITFTGLGNIHLYDFDLDVLEINNSGASNIEADNVTINQLNLIVNGAANAELSNISVTNCQLDISGAANIELKMSGGVLSGQISGAANVVYSGTVSEESVNVSGIGSLKKQ